MRVDSPTRLRQCSDSTSIVESVIHARKNTTPRRLCAPGPNPAQLDALLQAAAAAPDHGKLTPWRFVLIPEDRREDLAHAFRQALKERDSQATPSEIEAAGERAARSPTLLLAIADMSDREPAIPTEERIVSLGCAIQNMLLLAQVMGFGSGLSSGRALQSAALRETLRIGATEHAICFVSFGSVAVDRPCRPRPVVRAFYSVYDNR